MGLVPSDMTDLGQRNSGLVKVWLGGVSEQGWREALAGPRGKQSLGQAPSYTISWLQNFVLRQRNRIAKHQIKKKKKNVFLKDVCLVVFFQTNGSIKLFCPYTAAVGCQPHPKHFALAWYQKILFSTLFTQDTTTPGTLYLV